MSDRELLELAAKAAGIADAVFHGPVEGMWSEQLDEYWNPLTDDGDALRLAVKLNIDVCQDEVAELSYAQDYGSSFYQTPTEKWGNDPYAATRRAIVRAAAEIGKEMK